jgi:long-chain acyl-CoA synthetase
MFHDVLAGVLRERRDEDALIWRDRPWNFAWLAQAISHWETRLDANGIGAGAVVGVVADFSPQSVAVLLAAIKLKCIVIPVWHGSSAMLGDRQRIGEIEYIVRVEADDTAVIAATGLVASHPHYLSLRQGGHPGLVLFSSGSTGEPKGTVHDLDRLLRKYTVPRKTLRTLAFLLFDHIGGLDTLFYSIANGSTLVIPLSRDPQGVSKAIADHHVEVLPTAPSFLNLLVISGAATAWNLRSLKYITYGAEMMPQATLSRCREIFGDVRFLQKYGTSEVGTLRSSSPDGGSLWVRIGGEGYEWRVRDGKLEIKAASAMLGYLNAPSPFTDDGWFITGDCVETDGDLIRFMGRESDVINVGGQKVHPADVEAVIAELPSVADVTVHGERNVLLGQAVCARVLMLEEMPAAEARAMIRKYCGERLPAYKVPARIEISNQSQTNERSKKVRRLAAGSADASDES